MAGRPSAHNAAACRKSYGSPLNTNYIDKLLGQLVKKGMVQVSGLLQNGRYQSRQFVPCYTKDEFLANMLEEQGVNQALFARIAVALFKNLPNQTNPSRKKS